MYDDVNGWFYPIDPATAPTDGKGTFATGVYGNILNWLTVSRTDGAMQAMIGGKAVNSSGNECSRHRYGLLYQNAGPPACGKRHDSDKTWYHGANC